MGREQLDLRPMIVSMGSMSKKRVIAVVVALVGALGIGATAVAQQGKNNVRPGWGFGDPVHVHTGPPGNSVNIRDNHVTVTNSNNQNSSSGDASVSHNTSGGSATSGNASNSNSSSTNVNVSN